MSDPGQEIEFRDGKFVVDKPFVGPIMEATNGKPELVLFRDAMQAASKIFGRVTGTDLMKLGGVTDHLRRHGI